MQNFTNLVLNVVSIFSQFIGIAIVVIGMVKAFLVYLKDVIRKGKSHRAIEESRLELGHAFSLGLGFLIGASIIKSTIAPSWDDIGKLAAIIAIRTTLNFFLTRDISCLKKMDNEENKDTLSN